MWFKFWRTKYEVAAHRFFKTDGVYLPVLRVIIQDQSGDIHYTEFLAATIEAVGATEVRNMQYSSANTNQENKVAFDKNMLFNLYISDTVRLWH